jgi:hypothetical protein
MSVVVLHRKTFHTPQLRSLAHNETFLCWFQTSAAAAEEEEQQVQEQEAATTAAAEEEEQVQEQEAATTAAAEGLGYGESMIRE